MVTDFIAAGTLASLLGASEDRTARHAGEIVGRLEAGQQLRLSRQRATRTADSLRLKYTLARERGVRVDGLDELVTRLSSMGDLLVRACVAEGGFEFALVVLSDDGEEVEAALCVGKSGPST